MRTSAFLWGSPHWGTSTIDTTPTVRKGIIMPYTTRRRGHRPSWLTTALIVLLGLAIAIGGTIMLIATAVRATSSVLPVVQGQRPVVQPMPQAS